MKCPHCGFVNQDNKVVDSRPMGLTIKRRRECNHCKRRYNTFEIIEDEYLTERNKHRYIGWTSGEIVTLIHLYNQGENKSSIAEKLGRSRHSVSRKLDKLMESGEYFQLQQISG
jgi:hypothetical protein